MRRRIQRQRGECRSFRVSSDVAGLRLTTSISSAVCGSRACFLTRRWQTSTNSFNAMITRSPVCWTVTHHYFVDVKRGERLKNAGPYAEAETWAPTSSGRSHNVVIRQLLWLPIVFAVNRSRTCATMNCAVMYDMNCKRNVHCARLKYHVQILVVLKVWQTRIKRLSYFMVAKTSTSYRKTAQKLHCTYF